MNTENTDKGHKYNEFMAIGASGHSDYDRAGNDFYATDPIAIDYLMKFETPKNVWEPACGQGHLANRLKELGVSVIKETDLVYRGHGTGGVDFLDFNGIFDGDILTNPPFNIAERFVRHAIKSCTGKVFMFLKIQFLESAARKKFLLEYPPETVYVFSKRISCARNGEFHRFKSSATCYAWFVWNNKRSERNTELKIL